MILNSEAQADTKAGKSLLSQPIRLGYAAPGAFRRTGTAGSDSTGPAQHDDGGSPGDY